MKKLVVLLALAGLMAGTAMAQDEGPNSFGLYFDMGTWMQNGTEGSGVLAAYMVIAGPTASAVNGLEILFMIPAGQAIVTGTSWVVPVVDVDSTPEGVAAGFGEPVIPVDGFAHLGQLNFVGLGGVVEIFAGPNVPTSIPGFPAFLDENLTELPLYFSVDQDGMYTDDEGWLTIPLAVVNYDGMPPVATEDATWSAVKGLFR